MDLDFANEDAYVIIRIEAGFVVAGISCKCNSTEPIVILGTVSSVIYRLWKRGEI